jgi:hypothetical protein
LNDLELRKLPSLQDPVLPMTEVLGPTSTTLFPVMVPEMRTIFLALPATAAVTIFVLRQW